MQYYPDPIKPIHIPIELILAIFALAVILYIICYYRYKNSDVELLKIKDPPLKGELLNPILGLPQPQKNYMCALSVVYDVALGWPKQCWLQPEWQTHFEILSTKAKEYDVATGQADCEHDEKKEKLQKLADELGIKINFPV